MRRALAAVAAVVLGLTLAACSKSSANTFAGAELHRVYHAPATELASIIETWLAEHPDGIGCVIGRPAYAGTSRVRSLTPELAKGLEFDLVVLVDPESFGDGIEGAVDRYVAMTRATQRLVVLTSG